MKRLLLALLILVSFSGMAFPESGWQGDYARDIATDTTAFNNHLSAADTDVQTALETLDEIAGGSVSDTSYDATSWDGVTDTAPSKNAVRDKIESLAGGHDAVTVTDSDNIDFTLTGQDITAIVKTNTRQDKIEFIIDGGGNVISAGTTGSKIIPFACTITGWELYSSASGSTVVTINKSTTTSPTAPSWSAISGTEKPTLSAAQRNTDVSLSSWTTAIAAGNQIQASVDSSDINGVIVLDIYITKT